ncbi:glycosyltransferase family protein [Klosneuvirus KNV1]|uniref:Glycosyltransferase family protein n=1 Tax=Klosneuvirus KNV1 TaxID=1977640 RepID=A0A1V0SIX1_9VIRU|nr:glycosyltransferase family protein [Klosneuvirus KNV1]
MEIQLKNDNFVKYNKTFNIYYIICPYDQTHTRYIMNVGDMYGKFLVESLLNTEIIHHTTIPKNMLSTDNVFQIAGSTISDSNKNTVILGTGIILNTVMIESFKDCYLVRGKFTLNKLKSNHPTYDFSKVKLGDPGLTLSYFINTNIEKKYDYGIMLHYADMQFLKTYFTDECLNKVKIIDVDNANVIDVANQMLQCKKIISSSLHGIIFSHSLGIPVSWIRLEKTKLTPDDIKFYDYLSIYNMENDKRLCNLIKDKLIYNNLASLITIDIDNDVMKNKKHEVFQHIINTFNIYNYEIKSAYQNYINNVPNV